MVNMWNVQLLYVFVEIETRLHFYVQHILLLTHVNYVLFAGDVHNIKTNMNVTNLSSSFGKEFSRALLSDLQEFSIISANGIINVHANYS